MAFDETQTKALAAKLSGKYVRTRRHNGAELSYIEAWHAIAEANRIFGYDAWDRQTLSSTCVWQGPQRGRSACAYTARVRVRVRAGDIVIVREGSGAGHGTGLTLGVAHEQALKSAETDAMKRALATFGNPFGLALYDKEQQGVRQRPKARKAGSKAEAQEWVVYSAEGKTTTINGDAIAYCAALKRVLRSLETAERVKAFWARNKETVKRLCSKTPDLRDEKGQHYSQLLERIYERRLAELEAPSESKPKTAPSPLPTVAIDKSKLVLGAPKRIRDKDHLRHVASQPCLVCGRRPTQAHHLRFAQPRALGRKVSDEWSVPLCLTHHRALHDAGDEEGWWRDRQLDPLESARRLWQEAQAGFNP